MKKIPLLLWLVWIAGALLVLVAIFAAPSSASKAWVWGLSPQRLALALFPFAGILVGLGLFILAHWAPRRYARLTAPLERLSVRGAVLSGGLSFWAALFLAGGVWVYRLGIAPRAAALAEPLGVWFPTLCNYLERLWPVALLAALGLAGWALYVLWGLRLPFYRDTRMLVGSGAAVFCLLATLFQWGVFLFRLHVFEQIPGWYWPIIVKPDWAAHGLLFGLFFLFFALILVLVNRFPRATGLHLVLISLAFIGLQYAIGWMEGRGAASLMDRFFLSYHRIYIEEACNAVIPARQAVVHYEELYPAMFLQTKPPGVLWLSFQINRLAGLPGLSGVLERLSQTLTLSEFLPRMVSAACRRSMVLVTLLFPFLAASTVAILYGFSRRLIGGPDYRRLAAYSAILFVLAPSIVMMALFLDQAFYPPLFLLLAGAILLAMRRKSFGACLVVGAALYGAIFLSFSMLPLLVIPVLYFAAIHWQERAPAAVVWANFKRSLLPMGLGGLLALLLFKLFLNYDVFTRYQRMMATRIEGDFYTRLGIPYTGEAPFVETVRQAWEAARLNNVELAVAIGFPVFVFFVVMGVRSLLRVLRREADATAAINASLFLAYVGLNVLRVVLGEAARLWMFWAPVMALLAVQYLLPALRRARWLMFALVALQFITVFLSYQHQDYLMPQLLP